MPELLHKQCRPSFHEGGEKINENDKKKIPTKWAGKAGQKKPCVRVQLGQELKKIISSSNLV